MKKTLKYIGLFIGLSILFLGILFLFKPQYWLKVVNPLKYKILRVETQIDQDVLKLNFQVVVSNDYFLPLVLDSIEYKVRMENKQFSEGKKIFKDTYNFGAMDTINLPLMIELNVIRGIIKNNQDQDSVLLEIDIDNFLELPISGATSFTIPISKKISTPNPPKFKVLGVEKKMLRLHDAKYELYFEVENPNSYEIDVQSITGDLEFPELFTGNIICDQGILVPPFSSAQSSATIDIDDLALVRDGLKVLFRPNKEWDYKLVLKLVVQKKDQTTMDIQIFSEGQMPMKRNN